MKKFIFSLFIFTLCVVGAQAQKSACCKAGSNSAACTAKAPASVSASAEESSAYAAKVAASDESIETRTDPITGNVSYVRKVSNATDNSVSYVNVSFDPVTNSFNEVPATTESHNCGMKAASTNGKSCCTHGAAAGKSCCAGKVASAKPGEKIKS